MKQRMVSQSRAVQSVLGRTKLVEDSSEIAEYRWGLMQSVIHRVLASTLASMSPWAAAVAGWNRLIESPSLVVG